MKKVLSGLLALITTLALVTPGLAAELKPAVPKSKCCIGFIDDPGY